MGWCCIISLLIFVGIVIFLIIHTNSPSSKTIGPSGRSGTLRYKSNPEERIAGKVAMKIIK